MQMPVKQSQDDRFSSTLMTSTRPSYAAPFLTSISPTPDNAWQHSSSQIEGTPINSIVININDGGSTGRGILIGILSAFGSAGIAVLVLAIFFFFRYTNRGRIILDRIGRPGEFDDEQAFAKEEAEALEAMDDLQRTEYLRAKGEMMEDPRQSLANSGQHSFKQTLLRPSKPIYRFHNSWRYKRKVCRLGNSSPSWKSPIALLRVEPRSSSTIPNAVCKAIFQSRNKTKYTIGRPKYTTNPRQV